jgi:hypothetical protein
VVGQNSSREAGGFKRKERFRIGGFGEVHEARSRSRFLLSSSFENSIEGIDSPKGQLSCCVHIGYRRLQLQKILPRSFFVHFETSFVTHGDDNSPPRFND